MKRTFRCAAAAAALAWATGGAVSPATAHSCGTPAVGKPKERMTVTVGVGAEEDAVVQVDITVPDGFFVESATSTGWTVAQEGAVLHFTGAEIVPAGCGYFDIVGTPARRETFTFPMKVHYPNGLSRSLTSTDPRDPFSAQILYAGTSPAPALADTGEAPGGGDALARGATTALVLVVTAAAVARGIRSRGAAPAPSRDVV